MPRSSLAERIASNVPGYVPPPPKPPREPTPKPKVVYRGTGVFENGETIHLPENLLFKKQLSSNAIGTRRVFRIIVIEKNG